MIPTRNELIMNFRRFYKFPFETVQFGGEGDPRDDPVLRGSVWAATSANHITSLSLKIVFKYLHCVLNPKILNVWPKYY